MEVQLCDGSKSNLLGAYMNKCKGWTSGAVIRIVSLMFCCMVIMAGCTDISEGEGPVTVTIAMRLDNSRDLSDPVEEVGRCYAEVYRSSAEGDLEQLVTTNGGSVVVELTFNEEDSSWTGTLELAEQCNGMIAAVAVAAGADAQQEPATRYYGMGRVNTQESTSVVFPAKKGYALQEEGPSGGYVFYEQTNKEWLMTGWRYLEAAPADWFGESIDPMCIWGFNNRLTQVTSKEFGRGERNTIGLCVLGESDPDTLAKTAVGHCSDASCGECIWYLPSEDELTCMHTQLALLDGFAEDGFYWSSTESDEYHAMCVNIAGSGESLSVSKALNNLVYVKPIRNF